MNIAKTKGEKKILLQFERFTETDIFKSSEVHEKRAILNFLLQNPTVEGKKLNYSLKIPFNSILELAQNPTCTNGLGDLDSNQNK